MLNKPMGIADSLGLFKDDALLFAPGQGFQYNSFDFVLLSLAMERASGKPFHHLVHDTVLEPLQMRHTMPDTSGSPQPGQAVFYSRSRQGFRPATEVDNRFKLAGGGYLSTVRDICRLGQATLQGEVAPAPVLERFLQTQYVSGSPTWYGLGWQASRDAAGRPYYGHIGNGVGGYGNFFVYPRQELVIAILINCTDPRVQPVLDLVVEAIHLETGSP
jgi:CubicO group peptidase (beta-lactamase class C family)